MNVYEECDNCGTKESILWHRFLADPRPVITPVGMTYREGQWVCLCDVCMFVVSAALMSRKRKCKEDMEAKENEETDGNDGNGMS